MTSEPQTYTEAKDELQGILRELESGQLDVDQVVSRVERAETLTTMLKAKIEGAKAKITNIIEQS